MAREAIEVVPGVSEAIFNAHTHNYRKVVRVGIDAEDDYSSPSEVVVQDDATVFANEKLGDTVGITVATLPTSTPV